MLNVQKPHQNVCRPYYPKAEFYKLQQGHQTLSFLLLLINYKDFLTESTTCKRHFWINNTFLCYSTFVAHIDGANIKFYLICSIYFCKKVDNNNKTKSQIANFVLKNILKYMF